MLGYLSRALAIVAVTRQEVMIHTRSMMSSGQTRGYCELLLKSGETCQDWFISMLTSVEEKTQGETGIALHYSGG